VERLLPPPEPVAGKPARDPVVAGVDDKAGTMEREQARIAAQLSAIAPAAGESRASAPPPAQVATVPAAPVEAKAPPKPATAPPATEKSTVAPPAAAAKKTPSSYRIQIASLRSEEAAKKAWDRLAKGNKDLLGKLEPDIVRIDLAGKGTFYRLQAGPVDDASAANSLCSSLKQRKIGCLVVRP